MICVAIALLLYVPDYGCAQCRIWLEQQVAELELGMTDATDTCCATTIKVILHQHMYENVHQKRV